MLKKLGIGIFRVAVWFIAIVVGAVVSNSPYVSALTVALWHAAH